MDHPAFIVIDSEAMWRRALIVVPCGLLLFAQAADPRAAFANLYKMASEMANQVPPDPNYDEVTDSFPYPSDVIKAWNNSLTPGNSAISADDKKTLVDCSANLKNAIDEAERGDRLYLTKVATQKQPPPTQAQIDQAKADMNALYTQAKADVAKCVAANDLATGALKSVPAPPGGVGQNVQTPPAPTPPYNPVYADPLPAMYGATTVNGEKFTLSTVAGRLVGQGYQGPVVGAYGTTAFSKASYTFTSTTQVTITAIWDKSGKPITLNRPVTIDMNPK